MAIDFFQKKLEQHAGTKLKVKINDNRSTMLSVKWEPDCTRVSLNRLFLEAPINVMEELACYIRKEHKEMAPAVKNFIRDSINTLDCTHLIDTKKLTHQGKVYNLQELYDNLNGEYFNDKLQKLALTWFGKHDQRNRSRISFGLYHHHLKLIKIHRILDNNSFPSYVIDFVLFHEMLHHVCPAYVDERGMHRIHSKEFKEREVQFRYYEQVQQWIHKHQLDLFTK